MNLNPAYWLERWIHRGMENWVPEGADPAVMAALDWADTDSSRVLIERSHDIQRELSTRGFGVAKGRRSTGTRISKGKP
jgi:hypothetical protein